MFFFHVICYCLSGNVKEKEEKIAIWSAFDVLLVLKVLNIFYGEEDFEENWIQLTLNLELEEDAAAVRHSHLVLGLSNVQTLDYWKAVNCPIV